MSGNVSSSPNQNITGLPRYPPVTLKDLHNGQGPHVQSLERFKPDPNKRLEVGDGLLPGLYLVIQPSGARSWAVRYRHASKPRKLTLGPYPVLDLSVARARAREALQVVALGRDPASEKQNTLKAARLAEPGVDTYGAIVATFLDRHARTKTKARTAEETERTFRLHVLPTWGERRIQDITRRDVIGLLDRIVDQGAPIAANRTLAAVRKLFNWALDRSIIESSPVSGSRHRVRKRAGTEF